MDTQGFNRFFAESQESRFKSYSKTQSKQTVGIQAKGDLGKELISKLVQNSKGTPTLNKRLLNPYVHISSLLKIIEQKYCPLQHKYDYIHLTSANTEIYYHMYDVIDLPTEYVFSVGRNYETITRNILLENSENGTVFGQYSCDCGSKTYSGENIKEDLLTECPKCNAKAKNYNEYVLRVGALVGSPDFILRLGKELKYTILEHKSISHQRFDNLKVVSSDYMLQVMMYLGLLKTLKKQGVQDLLGVDINEFDDEKATILYVAKKYATDIRTMTKSFDIVWENEYPQLQETVLQLIRKFEFINDITEYNGAGLGHSLDGRERIKSFDKNTCQLCQNCPYNSKCEALVDKRYRNLENDNEGVL